MNNYNRIYKCVAIILILSSLFISFVLHSSFWGQLILNILLAAVEIINIIGIILDKKNKK
ncbi:MAG TPA: hypothetical protein DCR07_01980 [Lactococcus sp.]|nr:hypothetical protein [Lactococcus sp.]